MQFSTKYLHSMRICTFSIYGITCVLIISQPPWQLRIWEWFYVFHYFFRDKKVHFFVALETYWATTLPRLYYAILI